MSPRRDARLMSAGSRVSDAAIVSKIRYAAWYSGAAEHADRAEDQAEQGGGDCQRGGDNDRCDAAVCADQRRAWVNAIAPVLVIAAE